MSMTTPPGWYQDPSAPTQERWWDGSAWSAHTRPPGQSPQFGTPQSQPPQGGYGYPQTAPPAQGYGYPQAPQPYGTPPPPPAPPGGGQGGSGGLSKGALIAVVVAGVAVVAAIITGVVVLGKDDDAPAPPVAAPTSATSPEADRSAPAEPTAPGSSGPSADATTLADQLNGITLPIPEGWEIPEYGGDREAATMQTDETYDCPAEGGFCRHGTVTSRTAPSGPTTPEAVAKADIAKATELAYGKDYLDREKHGGVTSHTEVKSEAVTVAGKQGYLVRWKVVTGKGPGGYVQSLAFPSSVGPGSLVLVRFHVDAGPGAPSVDVMDTITQGIRSTT
ncbi:DUF2510 domain-containing protein [Streptomyces sp. CA-294286]|uniref:DUF2510 domain-containing protein n=1 Tax=Streptomyces sp. CA-294286 TaxID=3240070 RepID=UPI003D8CEDBE